MAHKIEKAIVLTILLIIHGSVIPIMAQQLDPQKEEAVLKTIRPIGNIPAAHNNEILGGIKMVDEYSQLNDINILPSQFINVGTIVYVSSLEQLYELTAISSDGTRDWKHLGKFGDLRLVQGNSHITSDAGKNGEGKLAGDGDNQANIFIGGGAGFFTTTAKENISIGYRSGMFNKEGSNNVYIGRYSGFQCYGSSGVYIGDMAGAYSSAGDNLVFIGKNAGSSNNGSNNVFIGRSSGQYNHQGEKNTYIGTNTGEPENNTSKSYSNNIFIGFETGKYAKGSNSILVGVKGYRPSETTSHDVNHKLNIGNWIFGATSDGNQLTEDGSGDKILGIATMAEVGFGLTVKGGLKLTGGGLSQSSDRRLKKNINTINNNSVDKLLQLRGVSYYWKKGDSKRLNYGLIAQEVRQLFPNLVTGEETENSTLSVNYIELIPLLIEGHKHQANEIIELKNEIDNLKTLVQQLLKEDK